MTEANGLFDIGLDMFRKLLYPEEWIKLDMDFSKAELFTLLQVFRNGEIIMSQIADYVRIPMSTATGVVERLVKNGLIERARSETDRRVVTIRLTEEGKKLADDVKRAVMEIIKYVFDALDEDEKELLQSLFFKVAGILSKMGEKQDLPSEEGGVVKKIEIE